MNMSSIHTRPLRDDGIDYEASTVRKCRNEHGEYLEVEVAASVSGAENRVANPRDSQVSSDRWEIALVDGVAFTHQFDETDAITKVIEYHGYEVA